MRAFKLLLLLSASPFVFGCNSTRSVTECALGVDPSTLRCRTEAQDSGGTAQNEPDSTPGPSQELPDVVERDEGPALIDIVEAVEDTGPIATEQPDVPISTGLADGMCIPGNEESPMDRRIGMPCTSHGQCESCYCYDEQYLSWGQGEGGAPFRFCTLKCTGGQGSSCAAAGFDDYEYACVKFTTKLIDDYELEVGGVCVPRCQSAAECESYAPQYNSCGSHWEGAAIQAVGTCQIEEPQ